MESETLTAIIFSVLGGFVPAFIWMAFWLQEDHDHPEPLKRILKAFVGGMVAVPIALMLQLGLHEYFDVPTNLSSFVQNSFLTGSLFIFLFAGIEEILKFLAAYFIGVHSRDTDEAVDVMVYMIAAALGFAALENTLYILAPLLEGDTTAAFLTGNMRFIGTTLIHVSASALVAYSLALAFFMKRKYKIEHILAGLFIATLLHTVFNLFIIQTQALYMIGSLILVWIGTLILFFLFEKIKKVHLNKI